MPLCGFIMSQPRSTGHRICRISCWAIVVGGIVAGIVCMGKHSAEVEHFALQNKRQEAFLSRSHAESQAVNASWETECTLGQGRDADTFPVSGGLQIERVDAKGNRADVTFSDTKLVHCAVKVVYAGDATSPSRPGGLRKADVFVGFDFKGLDKVAKCQEVLNQPAWPNIKIYKVGQEEVAKDVANSESYWACGNATYVDCTWSDKPKKSDCRTVFTKTVAGGSSARSQCFGKDPSKSSCFRHMWDERCSGNLRVGSVVPCVVEHTKGGLVRIGSKKTLLAKHVQGLPERGAGNWRSVAIACFVLAVVLVLPLLCFEFDDTRNQSQRASSREVMDTKPKDEPKEDLMANREPEGPPWRWWEVLTCGCTRASKKPPADSNMQNAAKPSPTQTTEQEPLIVASNA